MNAFGSELQKNIPFLSDSKEVTKIHKGYSNDEKYIATFPDESQCLIRVFELSECDAKEKEFEVVKKMALYNVKCSRPIQFGQVQQLSIGYMILSYIEGDDAEEHIGFCSEEAQYNIGLEAGRELLKIHQLQAPAHVPDWYERKKSKHNWYIEQYKTCGYKIDNDDKILDFINDHMDLMKNRPNLLQHDDFHVGNIIIKDDALAGVIDFNRYDWGDPIHEFLKVAQFSSAVSVPFSIGQIMGYHNNKSPDELFWKLYSLYTAMVICSSVVWILRVKPDELNKTLKNLYRVLDDHDYFDRIIPKWYG